MTHTATLETASALVAQSSEMIEKILRKQMAALLEQMEVEFGNERTEKYKYKRLAMLTHRALCGVYGPDATESLAAIRKECAEALGIRDCAEAWTAGEQA